MLNSYPKIRKNNFRTIEVLNSVSEKASVSISNLIQGEAMYNLLFSLHLVIIGPRREKKNQVGQKVITVIFKYAEKHKNAKDIVILSID